MNGNGHSELNDIRVVLAQIAASQAKQERILELHTDWLKDHDRVLTEHSTLLNGLAENVKAIAQNVKALAENMTVLTENGVRLDTRLNALVSICDDLIRNKRDRKKRDAS
jgi:septal ring factor EnvC (AmiA/AmiB activator)